MEKQRREKLHFRVSEEEKERIKGNAEKAGLSMSKYIRSAALKRTIYDSHPPQLEGAYKKLKIILYWVEHGETKNMEKELREILALLYDAYLYPKK